MSVSSGGDDALPWDVDALLEDLDDDVNAIGTNTPLEAFLAAHGLKNFLGVLAAEKIDLESLCLCRLGLAEDYMALRVSFSSLYRAEILSLWDSHFFQ